MLSLLKWLGTFGIILLLSLKCKSSPTELESKYGDLKILFIGSSYLSYNNLPEIFRQLALNNDKTVFIGTEIINGTYLDYHSDSEKTEDEINQHNWDYIVMQGGCTNIAYPANHHLIFPPYQKHPVEEALKLLLKKIHDHCRTTRAVYFMPWAFEDGTTWIQGQSDTYFDMQDNIYNNTLDLIEEIDMTIAPVGWAYRSVLQEHTELHYLYREDYNHPSYRGSYLSACVIYATLFQESLMDVPYYGRIPKDEAIYLQTVASTMVLDNLELWNISPFSESH